MITQKQAEEIVKRYSPTTRVIVSDSDSMDGIYLQKINTISIANNWSVAGLLHEITHAILILEDDRVGHDGVFADRFTKIVDDYYGEQVERLQEQLKEANVVIKWYDGLEKMLIGWELCTGQKKGTAEKYLKKWGVK